MESNYDGPAQTGYGGSEKGGDPPEHESTGSTHGDGRGPAHTQFVEGVGVLTWNAGWYCWVDASDFVWQQNDIGWWHYWDGATWVNPNQQVAKVLVPEVKTTGPGTSEVRDVPVLTPKQRDAAAVRDAASGGGVWTMASIEVDGAASL